MVYISETKVDPELKVVNGLSKVYGLGRVQSLKYLNRLGIQESSLFSDLSKNIINSLKKLIDGELLLSSQLKQKRSSNIKNLIKIRSYRGSRHQNCLPVRGQRTSTNAKTQKRSKSKISKIKG